MEIIKPKALKTGMTVGLIAPSGVLREEGMLAASIAGVERWGYRVIPGKHCARRYGYLAGEDEARAEDLNAMFRDDRVDGIVCVRGGYGVTRIQHLLDYDAIRANPKVLSGYSDITGLHSALLTRAGLVSFHGSMGWAEFAHAEYGPASHESFLRCVAQAQPAGLLDNPAGFPRRALIGGRAEGRLIGGNLSLMAACCGTPYAYDFADSVVFFEEIGEKTYAVDRMLTQLIQSGDLGRCRGVLLGEFTDCTADYPDFTLPLEEIFRDRLASLGVPVLAGVRCGHCSPRLTLPFGVRCRMDAERGTLEIVESAVK